MTQPWKVPMSEPVAVPRTAIDVADPEITRRNNVVIRVLIVGAFTVILNETVMGVAIPHLMADLGITAVAAQWLTTAFLLTMAVVIPVTGFLLQRFPTRPLFITAMSLFVAGTAIAAVAPGFAVLLLARVVQASGTAIMLPLLMTTVISLVPAAERGRRMGNISIVIAVAPALGPTISGLILSQLDWRFLFVFVLPVAGAVLGLGIRYMRTTNDPRRVPIDLLSVLLSAVGFGGLVYGLSQIGESAEGGLGTAIVAIAIGAAVTALFVWRQIRLQTGSRALLDLRVFTSPTFSVSVGMFVVSMISLFGTIILLPLYMQNVLGMNVLQSGLLLLPGGIIMGVMAPFVGRAYDRIGPRPLLIPGVVLVSASLWALAITLDPAHGWWPLLACHMLLSVGLALVFTPLFTVSLASLPRHLYSFGSATVSTVQQVAAAAGTALFVSTMAAVAAATAAGSEIDHAAETAGIRAAFLVGAILSTAGILLALWIRRPVDGENAESGADAEHVPAH